MTEEGLRSGNAGRWRTGLIAACLFSLLLQAVQIWSTLTWYGKIPAALSFGVERTSVPFVQRVTTPSRRGQIRRGDVIDWRLVSPGERFRSQTRFVAGADYMLPIVRGGHVLFVPFKAEYEGLSGLSFSYLFSFWLGIVGNVWIVLFALLLSVRVPQSGAARLLVAILLCQITWVAQAGTFVTPWIFLDAAMAVFSALGYGASLLIIAVYASTFARPLSVVRKVIFVCASVSALVATVLVIAYALGPFGTVVDGSIGPPVMQWLGNVVPNAAAFLALIAGITAARGLERARLIWATASLGMLFIPASIGELVTVFVPTFAQTAGFVANVSSFLTPVGLSYVLLNRRLLDIGFSLNRATVFAILSLFVFGTFNLAEWALGGWLGSLNRTANAGVSAALALALGLSLKPMHDGVERVVDRVFFRKRYETERALEALTQKAPHFREATSLMRELADVLSTQADASSTVLLRDDRGRFGDLDPDDDALVSLRTWSSVLDLHALRTGLTGEYAFPMIVRGDLTAVLVIGAKAYREPYAPDELIAIGRLAKAIGIALDGLSRDRNSDVREVPAIVRSLKLELVGIVRELHELREHVASMNSVQSRDVASLEAGDG
jgi:hypothetical protein